MKVERRLVDAAIRVGNERFPDQPWEGAATLPIAFHELTPHYWRRPFTEQSVPNG